MMKKEKVPLEDYKYITCSGCGDQIHTELPQSIELDKCLTCREKDAGRRLLANA